MQSRFWRRAPAPRWAGEERWPGFGWIGLKCGSTPSEIWVRDVLGPASKLTTTGRRRDVRMGRVSETKKARTPEDAGLHNHNSGRFYLYR
mgnify:CR=1 FL=1|jgi:hypothetical protein